MKIEKIFNKKKGVHEYQARFQLSGKEFRPKASTRKTLNDTIDEIRAREHRTKFELPVAKSSSSLRELFDKHLPRVERPHQRKIATRVFNLFLLLNGEDLKILEVRRRHFQKYIDYRLAQTGKQTKKPILPETVDKELYALSSALKGAWQFFPELEDYRKPDIPKATAQREKETPARADDKKRVRTRSTACRAPYSENRQANRASRSAPAEAGGRSRISL